jgi:hypothetical protein
MGPNGMTEMFMDFPETYWKHTARMWAICIKHRERYGYSWCTAGLYHECQSCKAEQEAAWRKKWEDEDAGIVC